MASICSDTSLLEDGCRTLAILKSADSSSLQRCSYAMRPAQTLCTLSAPQSAQHVPVIPTAAGRSSFPSFACEGVGLRSGGISLRVFQPFDQSLRNYIWHYVYL